MKGKMCNTPNTQCPAFDERFCHCGLGFPIEVKKTHEVYGNTMRYYGSVGECTKPRSQREYVKMRLG